MPSKPTRKRSEITAQRILLHRIYDPEDARGGCRFLVDRLWPRGIKKDSVRLDAWLKEVAPSNELRLWYQHDPDKWEEFKHRYFSELESKPESWQPLLEALKKGAITLLYSSRETKLNNAEALKEYLEEKIARG
jgi:uncharacterized protein YeaO (DUF488 family)